MTTHQQSILGALIIPDATARCFVTAASNAASFGGSAVWNGLVIVFNQPSTQTHGFYGLFVVPQNYVGSGLILPTWGALQTSGNCKWTFNYRSLTTGAWNQTSWEESPTTTGTPGGAAYGRVQTTITPTAANFAAGESIEYYLTRSDAASAEMAGAAYLFDLLFSYADA